MCLLAVLPILACRDDPVGPAPACGDSPELTASAPLEDSLTTTDQTLDGSYIDYYTLRLTQLDVVRLTMTSAAFDPFLYLWHEDESRPAAHAYDPRASGTPRVSTLTLTLEPGCYRVGASAWHRGGAGMGAYTLRAERLGD